MPFLSDLPWQLALEELFTRALAPPDVAKRDPFGRLDDVHLHSPDQNSILRLRSYVSDGHDYRQEVTLAAGQAVGQVLVGTDRELDTSLHLTFADVLLKVGNVIHLRAPKDMLLWNYTPFNPRLNPTFSMPPGLSSVEDAFAFAKAQTGTSFDSVKSVQDEIATISSGADLSTPGFADFSDPFATFCTLTAQKLPQWNYAAILYMQLLFQSGGAALFLSSAPGAPVVPTPAALKLLPLIQQNYTTGFTASLEGKVMGATLRELLKSAVPGLGAALP